MQRYINKTAALLLALLLVLCSCEYLPDINIPGFTDTMVTDRTGSVAEDTTTAEITEDVSESGDTLTSSPDVSADGQTSSPPATDSIQNTSQSTPTETTSPVITPETELTYDSCGITLTLTSSYAFIADAENMSVIFTKGDKDAKIYPASITKLVTALVALSYADEDTEFTVGSEQSLVAYDASVAGLKKGDVITLEGLLYALLLPSGGDAAYTIAANVGRIIANDNKLTDKQACAAFLDEMNEFAKNIGMKNTLLESPDGYVEGADGGTTLEDMAILGIYCVKDGSLEKYTSCAEITVNMSSGRSLTLKNTNYLIDHTSAYFDSSVFGLKTGSNDKAGKCLLACANINGKVYVIGGFLSKSTPGRFNDIKAAVDAVRRLP